MQNEYETKVKKEISNREKEEIKAMIDEFYQDLKYFEIEQARERQDREKRRLQQR